MRDGLFFPLLALIAAGMIALAMVWPRGAGTPSPAPFGPASPGPPSVRSAAPSPSSAPRPTPRR